MENTMFFDLKKNEDFKEVDMIIDWLQFTIHQYDVNKVLNDCFNTELKNLTYTESGLYGYNRTLTYLNKIHIMYSTKRRDMGVHVQMSGSACREFEQLHDWRDFFLVCFSLGARFTRIDIAVDTYKKFFTVDKLKKEICKGNLCSKFKKSTYLTQLNIKDGSTHSSTLHFGSMKSNIYIVIYDKLAERADAGYNVAPYIDFWTRCELRFKHELATNIVSGYVASPDTFGSDIKKILYNYLDFKVPALDPNKSRWKTAKFWLDFLAVTEKLCVSSHAVQSSIQKKKAYAETYMAKLISMVSVCDNDFLRNLINNGIDKINDDDLGIINSYCIANNLKIVSKEYLELLKTDKHEQIDMFNFSHKKYLHKD